MFKLYEAGFEFRKITENNLSYMKKYFIKSQINDWNLQSYIDNFCKIITQLNNESGQQIKFPLSEIENYIKEK